MPTAPLVQRGTQMYAPELVDFQVAVLLLYLQFDEEDETAQRFLESDPMGRRLLEHRGIFTAVSG